MKLKLQIPAIALLLLIVKLSFPAFCQKIEFKKLVPSDEKTFKHITGIVQVIGVGLQNTSHFKWSILWKSLGLTTLFFNY